MIDRTPTTTIRDRSGQEHKYTTTLLPVGEALPLGAELIGLLGETFDLSRGVGSALSGFASGLLTRGHEKLILRLLDGVARDGDKVTEQHNFELAYAGNFGELLRALEWVIEANFGDFSEAARDVVGGRLERSLKQMSDGSATSWLTALLSGASGSSSTPGSAPGATSETGGASPNSKRPVGSSRRNRKSKRS